MNVIKEFIFKIRYMILIIFILVVFLIGSTYAWVNIEVFGTKTHTVSTGNLVITLDESTCSGISLSNNYPISDNEGMAQLACTFTIENSGTLDSQYSIYLDDLELSSGERISDSNVKYSLVKNGSNSTGLVSDTGVNPTRVLDNGIINASSTNTYELRFWIDSNSGNEIAGKSFFTKLRVESINYEESGCTDLPTYGGIPNEPELVGDMIPVIYDGTNWIKADINNVDNTWYDYDEQMWANVVTVTETNRATHVAAAVGTTIPMEDINTFMVWIPRYSYTIKDTYGVQGCGGDTPAATSPGAFDIKFIDSNTTDLGSAEYTGDTAENWFTNSAFCWGNSCDDEATRVNEENKEISGIWVAKFESSHSTCTIYSCGGNSSNQPTSIPNIRSWRDVNVFNAFNSVQQYMNSTSGETIYGLTGDNYDAHMMKNTEWGAVAYLTQSRYGKYGNEDYTGVNKEVAINNCQSMITGIAGDTVTASMTTTTCTTNTYDTEIGQTASTTGNITGIYDMNGGAREYVMGTMQKDNLFYSNLSGFTTAPEAKYYNSYKYGSGYNEYHRYIKGDATKEMSGFYRDSASFVHSEVTWFFRGGYYSDTTHSGPSKFRSETGTNFVNASFRFVIS